jgi:hypothetical protein
MGASTWGRMELHRQGDIAGTSLRDQTYGLSICAPEVFYPWSHTGTKLAWALIGRGKHGRGDQRVVIFDIETWSIIAEFKDTTAIGIIWSPVAENFLLIRNDDSEIVTVNGDRQRLDVESGSDGLVGAWTPDGRHVVLAPPSRGDTPGRLLFVNARLGTVTANVTFDSRTALPFEEERFRTMASGRHIVDPEGQANTSWPGEWYHILTNRWTGSLYSASASSLYLSTYRPSFLSHEDSCYVHKRWVQVKLKN